MGVPGGIFCAQADQFQQFLHAPVTHPARHQPVDC
jgi:hypothetical protein